MEAIARMIPFLSISSSSPYSRDSKPRERALCINVDYHTSRNIVRSTLARPAKANVTARAVLNPLQINQTSVARCLFAYGRNVDALPQRSQLKAFELSQGLQATRRFLSAVPAGAGADAVVFQPGENLEQYSIVMKFGGSSLASAERMREVASIVLNFPDHMPILVLSAMGDTTNQLLAAGEQSLQCENSDQVGYMKSLQYIRKFHQDAMDELNVDPDTVKEVNKLLKKLEQICTGVALMQECTSRTRATLVSFGERISTRIFSTYLRSVGLRARQNDAFDELGIVTTDEFENGNVLDVTYSNVAAALKRSRTELPNIAVVTGFLGRGEQTGAITTLGRGGSDLTATIIGAALQLPEVQVWKDVDGVLSADPREVDGTIPMTFLSFQEATELAYFGAQVLHPQSMRPAMDSEGLCVRVKNSYNLLAPGTLIGHVRPGGSDDWLLTSIVRKKNVTMLDIISTRMLGQYGFLAKVFAVMNNAGISVDCVATSEVSVSITLDPAKLWSRGLVKEELEALVRDFEENGIARVNYTTGNSLVSLIGNVERNKEIMERSFRALGRSNVIVKMISQGASKTNISLLVGDEQGIDAVKAIHAEFFNAKTVE